MAQLGTTSFSGPAALIVAAQKNGNIYVTGSAGTITGFNFFASGNGTAQTFTPVIFSVVAGAPAARLATGTPITIGASQAFGAVSTPISLAITAGTSYCLALLSGLSTNGAFVYYNTGGTSHAATNTAGNSTPDSTWGTDTTGTNQWVFFVDYTPTAMDGGAGVDTASIMPATVVDTGTGTDKTTSPILQANTGTGTDKLAVTAPVPLSDTGVGVERSPTVAIGTYSDTGAGTDAQTSGGLNTVAQSDSGAGVDSATAGAQTTAGLFDDFNANTRNAALWNAAGNTMQGFGPTEPAAPVAATAVAGNAQATVNWTAPNNGGSPILTYTVTAKTGGGGTLPSYGVSAAPTSAYPALAAAGLTHVLIQAYWSDLQPAGVGTPLDSPNLAALNAQFAAAAAAGLRVIFEYAMHVTPPWVQSAVEQYTDQAGFSWTHATTDGTGVRNWVWTALGRTYVADFITKVAAGIGPVNRAAVDMMRVGAGYFGEMHYVPVNAPSTTATRSFYAYGTSMQTGAGLAAGLAVCPWPGYVIWSGTPAKDADMIAWYLGGLSNYERWQAGQYKTAGWTCPLMVLHPGFGIRDNMAVTDGSYHDAAAAGAAPELIMAGYASDPQTFPWCTWLEDTNHATPTVVDTDYPAWKKIYSLAVKYGKTAHVGGENAATNIANSVMDTVFADAFNRTGTPPSGLPQNVTAAQYKGYTTLMWVDYPSLVGGAGGFPTLANYGADIVANGGGAISVVTTGLAATVPGLINGTAYTFGVVATNAVGTSLASNTAPVTPTAGTGLVDGRDIRNNPALVGCRVPAGSLTLHTGDWHATAGESITRMHITGSYIPATNSSVTDCRIDQSYSCYPADPAGSVATYCNIGIVGGAPGGGAANGPNPGLRYGGATLRFCHIAGFADGIFANNGVTDIEFCYIHDLIQNTPTDHNDLIQMSNGGNVTINGCWLDRDDNFGGVSCLGIYKADQANIDGPVTLTKNLCTNSGKSGGGSEKMQLLIWAQAAFNITGHLTASGNFVEEHTSAGTGFGIILNLGTVAPPSSTYSTGGNFWWPSLTPLDLSSPDPAKMNPA